VCRKIEMYSGVKKSKKQRLTTIPLAVHSEADSEVSYQHHPHIEKNDDLRLPRLCGVKETDCHLPSNALESMMALPCCYPLSTEKWRKLLKSLRAYSSLDFILVNDFQKKVSLEPHFEISFFALFHVLSLDVFERNHKDIALDFLRKKNFITLTIRNTILSSPFVNKHYQRSIEYFKRDIPRELEKAFRIVESGIKNTAFRWLTSPLLSEFKVIHLFYYILITTNKYFCSVLWRYLSKKIFLCAVSSGHQGELSILKRFWRHLCILFCSFEGIPSSVTKKQAKVLIPFNIYYICNRAFSHI